MRTKLEYYLFNCFKIFRTYLLALGVLFIFRVVFAFRFSEPGLFKSFPSDILSAFVTGLRVDTLIILYTILPLAIFSLPLIFIRSEGLSKGINAFSRVYATVILTLLCALMIVDQQFFSFFQSHLNVLAFGIAEDDTSAVLKSMWTDHPVIRVVFLVIILAVLFHKALGKIFNNQVKPTLPKVNMALLAVSPLLFIGIYFLGMRGSVGIFPFLMDDTTVSSNAFVNQIATNGIFNLKQAFKERKEQVVKVPGEEILKRHGYTNLKAVLGDYFEMSPDSFIEKDYTKYLFLKTDTSTFIKNNPPNVVFFLMESMGGYYLNFHSKEMNLLGALEHHMAEDILFRNFICSTRGTIYSLESIMINTPFTPLTSGNHRFLTFSSSAAKPFHDAGYRTSFVTGGKTGWRNLHEFVPRQYFDEVEGKDQVLQKVRGSKENTWGVYDQYLFDYVFNKLMENKAKPNMIFALSTTNHTPYELPAEYKPAPLSISDSVRKIIQANSEIAQLNFTAYQYSNDCLGKFIGRIKNSPLGKNTIIAATGDHNNYGLFPFEGNLDILKKYEVPFYIYIPEAYKRKVVVDASRYGSHKDIFTTIYPLALSGQSYFALGNNLLATGKTKQDFYGLSQDCATADLEMSKQRLDKKVNAWRALSEYYINDQFKK